MQKPPQGGFCIVANYPKYAGSLNQVSVRASRMCWAQHWAPINALRSNVALFRPIYSPGNLRLVLGIEASPGA